MQSYTRGITGVMFASGRPPDVVRAAGAPEIPFLVAGEPTLDLDPANDVWRFDGAVQGRGPWYGMARDYSQDGMFWYDTERFERAGVDPPDTTRPPRPRLMSAPRRFRPGW